MFSSLHARLATVNTGPDWERPTPSPRALRADIVSWAVAFGFALCANAGYHSVGLYQNSPEEIPSSYWAATLMTLPLLIRRRYPLTTLLVGTLIFYLVGIWNRMAGTSIIFQLIYFSLVYTSVAWAKKRQLMWSIFVLICLSTLVWLIGMWAVLGARFSLLGIDSYDGGPFSPDLGTFIIALINNIVFFGFAAALGQNSWTRAYQYAVVEEQAELLRAQSKQMAKDAVTRERLRISRELHDSVGHHVSAMSIQAAAARKVLAKRPELAAEPLAVIEELARSSVGEMKQLVGVLRAEDADGSHPMGHDPQLSDLPELIERTQQAGLTAVYRVEAHNPATLAELSQGTQLSLYRIVQEALNNSLKHAQALSVLVVARTGVGPDGDWVEVEIVDDGRARTAPSGGGFGLQGIQERAVTLGGIAEIGPRIGTEGWRVRVRIPVKRSRPL